MKNKFDDIQSKASLDRLDLVQGGALGARKKLGKVSSPGLAPHCYKIAQQGRDFKVLRNNGCATTCFFDGPQEFNTNQFDLLWPS